MGDGLNPSRRRRIFQKIKQHMDHSSDHRHKVHARKRADAAVLSSFCFIEFAEVAVS